MQKTLQMGDDQPAPAQQQRAHPKHPRHLSAQPQQQGIEPEEAPLPQMGSEIFTDWASI